jgi:hypothetical protein
MALFFGSLQTLKRNLKDNLHFVFVFISISIAIAISIAIYIDIYIYTTKL